MYPLNLNQLIMKIIKPCITLLLVFICIVSNAQEDLIIGYDDEDHTFQLDSSKLVGLAFRNPYCSNFSLTEVGVEIDWRSSSGEVKFALFNNLGGGEFELLWESVEVAVTGGVDEYVYADIPEGDVVLDDMQFYMICMIGYPDSNYIQINNITDPDNNGVALNHSQSTLGRYSDINYPDFPDTLELEIAWYRAINMVAKGVPEFVTITPNEANLDTLRGAPVTVYDIPKAIASCGGTIQATTDDPLEYTKNGVDTITWTFKKGYYYAVEQTQIVVVNDTIDPVIPVLSDTTGDCSLSITPPTTTDACVGTITGTTTDQLVFTKDTSYAITWTFDDGNGNSVQAIQNVVFDDTTSPVIPSLADLSGDCSLNITPPTTTDACAGTITGTTTDQLVFTKDTSYAITWTFDDGNGNSVQAIQNVVFDDATSPVIPSLADLSGDCSLNITPPIATDTCAGKITGTTTDPLIFTKDSTYTITWTFDDGNGNSVQRVQDIEIIDTTPPVLPLLPDLYANCSLTVPIPTTTDGCSGSVSGTTSDTLEYTQQGNYSVTWYFKDISGNVIEGVQSIIIEDTIAPTFSCIEDQTVNLAAGEQSYTIQGTDYDLLADDNCTVDSVVNNLSESSSLDGVELSEGVNTITWQAFDNAGNRVECSYTVTVNSTLSLGLYTELTNVSIYPNPTSGVLTIKNPAELKGEIIIADVCGKIQGKVWLNSVSETVDISDLNNGIYVIQIKTENNMLSSTIIKR